MWVQRVAISATPRAICLNIAQVFAGRDLACSSRMKSHERRPLLLRDVTEAAIRSFYDSYNELAGFPEFVLIRGLTVALEDEGLAVHREVSLPVWFRGRRLTSFRADLIVDPGVLIEVKCAAGIEPFHKVQLLHYLKATDIEVGLLFNFGKQPQFSRIVYENARKRRPIQVPEDVNGTLGAVPAAPRGDEPTKDP
jgi:GxxExxY protein